MKKLLLGTFVLFLGFGLAACGGNNDEPEVAEDYEPEIVEEVADEEIYEEMYEIEDDSDEIEEVIDPLAADNAMLANWVDSLIDQFEDINVDDGLFFLATLGGVITGSRSGLEDLSLSTYAEGQIDIILRFLEDVQTVVVENFGDESLDFEEVRDIIIETLNSMRNILLGLE